MKQLLIRADDIGYSYAVNVGIARSVHEGLVRSVGVMPNMPEAPRGVDWVRNTDIAIGQHTNVCLGTPCSDPASIPSLVDKKGQFKSSRTYREAFTRGEDFVNYDEAVAEAEAQLARFIELVGREPDYFEAHAVASENLNRAIEHVARTHGYRYQAASFDSAKPIICGKTPIRMVMRSMTPGYDPDIAIRETVDAMGPNETVVFVCHPGYLDQFILNTSSLTTDRTKEVDALISPGLRTWLEAHPVLKLIDYRDL